jgi:hypothetical protein
MRESTDQNGRYIILDIEISGDTIYTLVNIYCPTKNHENEQIEVINAVFNDLKAFDQTNIIFCGDLNICLNPDLDKIYPTKIKNESSKYRKELKCLLETENLIDIWRNLNPGKKCPTWCRGQQKSRLDYFLVSDHIMNRNVSCEILHSLHSDHNQIKLKIGSKIAQRQGKGFWKFNANLLQDMDYIKQTKYVIEETIKEYENNPNYNTTWEILKLNIRNNTIQYSIKKAKERNRLYKSLQNEYYKLEEDIKSNNILEKNIADRYQLVKSELEAIEKYKTKGAIIRSKISWTEEGEKNSAFFLRQEKQNYLNKTITELKVNGKYIDNPKDILKAEKEFYSHLYQENTDIINNTEINTFISDNYVPKIKEDIKKTMDEPITEKEILYSLKSLKNNKSPGTDGLTTEFFKFFWSDIKELLLNSYTYSLNYGNLSCEQKRGIISLIPKKDKDRHSLSNWRPLTLLNTDYKILSKAIANRIKEQLPDIISEDQNGFIKGRYIGINIRKIEDVLQFTNNYDIPGYIMNLDFEKAFDTIKWSSIYDSLRMFNFGENMIRYINTLYNNISSCVINNGSISEWFYPNRGVRQGCPLSPYLFILVAEILAIKVRCDTKINGISINNGTYLISQLADDTMLFLSDIDSVKHILTTLEEFKNISGLKINQNKTELTPLGPNAKKKIEIKNLKQRMNSVKSLGIEITGNEEDHYNLNFKARLIKIKSLLNNWKQRTLSLKGKITIINSLIIPMIIYPSSLIYTPQTVISELKTLILDFIWHGKTSKISYNTLIQRIDHGGLKLIDIESKITSIQLNWIKRLIDTDMSNWQAIVKKLLNSNELEEYFKQNRNPVKTYSLFYNSIIKNWGKLRTTINPNKYLLKNEIIWNNKHIKINEKSINWKKWINSGIYKIEDILDKDSRFLKLETLKEKYKLNVNILNYISLIKNIPKAWLEILKDKSDIPSDTDLKLVRILNGNINAKDIYWILVDRKYKEHPSIRKWEEDYPALVEENEIWPKIYYNSYITTRETTLQSFQYRIINRTINCTKKLYDWGISSTPNCLYCGAVDNIIHFLLKCEKVKNFWKSLLSWWNSMNIQNIYIYGNDLAENIIFGFHIIDETFRTLNYICLNAKYYIYKKRIWENNNICFFEFLIILKNKLIIEKQICIKTNREDMFRIHEVVLNEL